MLRSRLLQLLLWGAAVLLPAVWHAQFAIASTQNELLLRKYERLSGKYAEAAGAWRPERPKSGSLLFIAPDQYSPPSGAVSGAEAEGGESLGELRAAYSDQLFELAKEAAAGGRLSLAIEWATEAVRENPNHGEARRALGYEQRDGEWLTPYGARMADSGKHWHPKFGWLEEGDEARYEAGERRRGNRWITAEEDAARRKLLKNGWQVRTDHFLVTTNHSLEAGVDLAARLERLHQIWRQLFAAFYLGEAEGKRLFAGERGARRQVRPFRVYYHRDRGEYGAALVRRQSRIAQTLGIYFDREREAHFFAGEDEDAGTQYHEAVHQLFFETRPGARHVGELANFWVVEGVATYFETLREHEDPAAGRYFTIGESTEGRIPAARERLLEDGFYMALEELAALGKGELQKHGDIAKLYSQAAGLTAFFMDGEEGKYREALVRYLEAIYAGRDARETLAETTGASPSQLDREYRRYMESLP